MLFRLLLGLLLQEYCLAGYVAHVYWPRSIIGYYPIPIIQKVRYILPTPEEVGHHLPAAIPVPPPAHHVMTAPDIIDVAPAAVEPSGTVVAHQAYPTVQTAGYQSAPAIAAPMMIATPTAGFGYQAPPLNNGAGSVATSNMQAAIYGDKQFSTEDGKSRVPKMAIAPSSAPQVEASGYSASQPIEQNAPQPGSYQEKPEAEGHKQGQQPELAAPEATGSEQSNQYGTTEDRASRTGYRLRRIVLQ